MSIVDMIFVRLFMLACGLPCKHDGFPGHDIFGHEILEWDVTGFAGKGVISAEKEIEKKNRYISLANLT